MTTNTLLSNIRKYPFRSLQEVQREYQIYTTWKSINDETDSLSSLEELNDDNFNDELYEQYVTRHKTNGERNC